jgi:thiamine-phosphate pyrophosphorylase
MSVLLKKRLARFKSQCLYPVITSRFCAGRSSVDVLEAILDAGAGLVQLREKDLSDRELLEMADKFRKLTSDYKALLIIDDRIDIALACGADGVHLGLVDLPLQKARELGPDLIIGSSTHNPAEIADAISCGASYINMGPIFNTRTKELEMEPIGIQRMRAWSKGLKIPFTVMGGIKAWNIPQLKEAGARCFAIVTEITQAENITEKVRSMLELCECG